MGSNPVITARTAVFKAYTKGGGLRLFFNSVSRSYFEDKKNYRSVGSNDNSIYKKGLINLRIESLNPNIEI